MKMIILLVVKDSASVARLRSALDEYTVLFCTGKKEAVQMCQEHEVAIVLVEDSPRINGYETFVTLREQFPVLSGVLLTSSVENDLLVASFSAGFSGILKMPVQAEHLRTMVKQSIERKKLDDENVRLRTLLPLYSLGEQFLSSTTEKEVLEGLLESVAELTGSSHMSILLYDEKQASLHIAASRGMDKRLANSVRIAKGEHIAGWVFKHGKPVILNKEDQETTIFSPFLKRAEIVSAISCPLIIRDNIIGVLNISQTGTDERFSEADKEVISIVCGQAAMALENVRALRQVEEVTRTRTLLEQYMAPEVAQLLLVRETELMELGDIRKVTILFADIRNFTALVQQLELDRLRAFLNDFFNIFTDTIFQQQGTVDKFMGDAVLAMFGAPIANQNATFAAVNAALMIKQKFEKIHRQWRAKSDVFRNIDLGIGITSGNVFLGNVGSSRRFDYTVIGNEVNIAQRLAAESSHCRIYLTESVRNDVHHLFHMERWGEMKLRGIEEPMVVYTIPAMEKL